MNPLVLLAVSLGINLVMFVPAFIYKTDQLTDISYAVTFAVVAIAGFAFSSHDYVHFMLLALVLVWAFRLGSFLLKRIRDMKRDKRFDGMRENFWAFLKFWLAQGASVFVILLAAILAWQRPENPTTGILPLVGLIIFWTGLGLEKSADQQKYDFNHQPASKGKWIEEGVWKLSRHPNYLGEMMVWVGVYLVAFETLSPTGRLVGLLSPLYIIGLLLFVSGVPILEKSADKKWGTKADYNAYKERVPLLIPTISSIKSYFDNRS